MSNRLLYIAAAVFVVAGAVMVVLEAVSSSSSSLRVTGGLAVFAIASGLLVLAQRRSGPG